MRIGDYQVQGELARGAFGVVYRAHDPSLRRDVAIKLLIKNDRTRSHELRRFTREARALARLHHPNIVTVLGSGSRGEHPYLVMKLVEGETLEARLERDGPLPPAEAVGIAIKLARAVDHAHQALILHRDIKPANVILSPNGEPLLTDFGLAKDLAPSNSDSISVDGRFMGTPGYWPPEQALGEIHRVGAPSDIYALGATLYACLTGRPPHPQETLAEALIGMERGLPIVAPSRVRPGVDPALDRIVLGCLERDPGDRYLSALDLADDLERWLRGESSRGPNANSRSGARRVGLTPAGAKRWAPALAFAGLSLTVIGAAVAVALTRPRAAPRSASPRPAPSPLQTQGPPSTATRADEARLRLSELTRRARAPQAFDPALVREIEAGIPADATAPALRRLLRRYMIRRGRFEEIVRAIPPDGDPGPYREESLWVRAKALDALGHSDAHSALERLAGSQRASVFTKLAQTLLEFRRGRSRGARAAAEAVLEIDPQQADALGYSSVLSLRRKQGDEALDLAKRALASAPDDFILHYHVARAYMFSRRHESVLQHLESACRLTGPKPPADLQVWRIKALYNLMRYDDAVRAANRLARDHPSHAVDADVMAGVIHAADGEPRLARRRWRKAHRADRKRFQRAVLLHPPPNLRAKILELVGER